MFTRILGGLALVLGGAAMALAANPHLAPAGAVQEGLAQPAAQRGGPCDLLPPGHPPLEACLPADRVDRPEAGARALPPGHPPIPQRALPPGHPPVERMPGRAMPLPVGPEAEGQDASGFPQGYLITT